MQGFVLVGGWPGSGKTTLSQALATELGIDCLSKDDFKEDLMDQLGAPATVKESRELGVAAVVAALGAAKRRTGAVIDSTWYPYSFPLVRQLPGPFTDDSLAIGWGPLQRRPIKTVMLRISPFPDPQG